MFGKSLIAWAVASLAVTQLAAAQPHNHRRGLLRRHPHPNVVTVKNTVATVYVDQHGNTIDPNSQRSVVVTVYATGPAPDAKTVTQKCGRCKPPASTLLPLPAETPKPVEPVQPVEPIPEAPIPEAPKPQPTTSVAVPEPQPTSAVEVKPEPEPTPSAVEPSTSAAPPQETSSPTPPRSYTPGTYPSGNKPGIVYSPYNADHSCKSPEQVAADVEKLQMFSPLRLYGVDCNQIQNVIAAGKKYGTQVFAGIWDVTKATDELETLIEAVDGNWDSVHTVAIGNEVVNFGRMDAGGFASVINASRKRLQEPSVGYFGPVVGVDTFVAIKNNPAICEASDYVAANCHSFFDGGVSAAETGDFLDRMKADMRTVCGDSKSIVITEVGWPSRGSGANGLAVPGVTEQQEAIKSVKETQGNDVILFTAFDDQWKKDTSLTFGTEKFWGIQDKSIFY